MPDQLVVDLSRDNNQATVLSWPAGCGTLSRVTVQPAAWPLGSGELDDLRWYLEDYLQAPYGVWEDRGPLVREKLAGWGELVFGAVFAALRLRRPTSTPGSRAWRWWFAQLTRGRLPCRGN